MGSNLREKSWGEFFCFPRRIGVSGVCFGEVSGSFEKTPENGKIHQGGIFFFGTMELVNSQSIYLHSSGTSVEPHLFLVAKQHTTEEPMNKSAGASSGRRGLRFDQSLKALKFLGLQANHESYLGGSTFAKKTHPPRCHFPNGSVMVDVHDSSGGTPFRMGRLTSKQLI